MGVRICGCVQCKRVHTVHMYTRTAEPQQTDMLMMKRLDDGIWHLHTESAKEHNIYRREHRVMP